MPSFYLRVSIFLIFNILTMPGISSLAQTVDKHLLGSCGSLPFGWKELPRLKYPYRQSEGNSKKATDHSFSEMSSYYYTLNNQYHQGLPSFDSLVFLDINYRQKKDIYFDSVCIQSVDTCTLRLPIWQGYSCYYIKHRTSRSTYGEYGSFLLIEPKKNIGFVINVYFEYGGDQNVAFRYFHVDKNSIRLYEGYCYDDGCILAPTHVITVSPLKKINIKTIAFKPG